MTTYTFTKAGSKGTEVYDSVEEALGAATRDMLSGTAWPVQITSHGIDISEQEFTSLCFDGLTLSDEEKAMVMQRAENHKQAIVKPRSVNEDLNPFGFHGGL